MIEDFTINITDWIEALPLISIYLAFLLVAYLENVVPPIPGDLLIVFAGYLAADGLINFGATLALTTIASVAGFMTMYWLGYTWGDGIREHKRRFWIFRYLNFRYMLKAQQWMTRWGQGVILANRFLAGTRSIISLMAGISQTNIRLTILSSTVSSLVWNFILLGAGWIIKENWERIGHYLNLYSRFILVAILLFVAFRLFLKWRRRRNLKEHSTDSAGQP